MHNLTKNNAKSDNNEGRDNHEKHVFFCKGQNLILSAEHYTVVQKQGLRRSVGERCLYAKMMDNPWKSIRKSMNDE